MSDLNVKVRELIGTFIWLVVASGMIGIILVLWGSNVKLLYKLLNVINDILQRIQPPKTNYILIYIQFQGFPVKQKTFAHPNAAMLFKWIF